MSTAALAKPKADIRADAKTLAFHRKTLIFDCLSLYYMLDEPYAERALEGGVNATNVTFGTEGTWDQMCASMETGLEKIAKSAVLTLATTSDDILRAQKAGKLAVIMGTQGSMMVDRDLYRLDIMARLGLRIFGLAYTGGTLYADGCGELRDAGVSFLGRELIDAVNRLPLLLDLSHCGHRTRAEATALARAPVCTHSNAYGHNPNDRNTKDETAKAIVAKGGAVGVCGLPKSVKPANATIEDMLDHCDYYRNLIGDRHVGIGLDFVEAYKADGKVLPDSRRWRTYRPDVFGTVDEFLTQEYPKGLSTILELPNYTQGLFDRGYTEEQVAGQLGGNWLRVFKDKIG